MVQQRGGGEKERDGGWKRLNQTAGSSGEASEDGGCQGQPGPCLFVSSTAAGCPWADGSGALMPCGCSLSEVQCIMGLLRGWGVAHPLAMGLIHRGGRKAWARPGLS